MMIVSLLILGYIVMGIVCAVAVHRLEHDDDPVYLALVVLIWPLAFVYVVLFCFGVLIRILIKRLDDA